jgi:hypothetical protein
MSTAVSTKKPNEQAKLRALQGKPKLVVSQQVSDQIKLLCNKFAAVEWSGVLYHTIEGDYNDPDNFKLRAEYILLMDVGSSAFTEYRFSDPSFAEALAEKPEFMDMKMGHIHSHNNMNVFFSGTDNDELLDNAPNYNYYLSLIINNKHEMVARTAIPGKITSSDRTLTCVNASGENVVWQMEEAKEEDIVGYLDCEITIEAAQFEDSFFTSRLADFERRRLVPPTYSYVHSAYQSQGQNWREAHPTAAARLAKLSPAEAAKKGKTFKTKKTRETIKDLFLTPDKKLIYKSNFSLSFCKKKGKVSYEETFLDIVSCGQFLRFFLGPIVKAFKPQLMMDYTTGYVMVKELSEVFSGSEDVALHAAKHMADYYSAEEVITAYLELMEQKDSSSNELLIIESIINLLNNDLSKLDTQPGISFINALFKERLRDYDKVIVSDIMEGLVCVKLEAELLATDIAILDSDFNFDFAVDAVEESLKPQTAIVTTKTGPTCFYCEGTGVNRHGGISDECVYCDGVGTLEEEQTDGRFNNIC